MAAVVGQAARHGDGETLEEERACRNLGWSDLRGGACTS